MTCKVSAEFIRLLISLTFVALTRHFGAKLVPQIVGYLMLWYVNAVVIVLILKALVRLFFFAARSCCVSTATFSIASFWFTLLAAA